ncbi:podoplanin isoform X1 [Alligator mississippiensis]|uniref:Podoplanin isoform A n=1 Tax=Alligator mississippiensis TaxID=8496 RepID=A0A151M7G8_ALLMI|nr:podoplanin isoform X1 [Alligator mississippiensis]KYO20473.1 podoplanin isoform A [Alligator mississippiensis]
MFLKTLLFVFLLGTVPFRAFAEEASSVLEDEESTTTDFKDRNDTWYDEVPTLLPTSLHNITDFLQLEDLMTTESAIATNEDSENSTDPDVTLEHADDELGEEPETTEEEGGLGTAALVGIIIGIMVAVGIIAGIIIAVVRKMSGRYSP